jgi:HCOMODA/2-hydroxy-3-carboxy-muconic semialdehyde decarboxylase
MEQITRRRFVSGGALVVAEFGMAGLVGPRGVLAQGAPMTAGAAEAALIEDLVAASRILADQGVVDGYGHVSAPGSSSASSTARSTRRGPT